MWARPQQQRDGKMKSKAEQAYYAALARASAALAEMSKAAHVMMQEQSDEDDAIDRIFWLGELANNSAFTCPPNARVLADLSAELMKLGDHDDEAETESTAAPSNTTEH
jgi:hypothetical protein